MALMSKTPEPGSDDGTAVEGLVVGLAIVSVVLRFYTRSITKVGLWWDDWLILASVLATVLTAILLIWGSAVNPLGEDVSENTDPTYIYTPKDVLYLKLVFISSILYFTIVGAAKLSILCMYNRLFAISTAFRRQLVVSGVLVLGFWIGCTVATLTNCIPLKWSGINGLVLADPRYCFNYNIFWVAAGACEVFIDVLILTLPIRAVHRLQLSRKQKVTVIFIFLLGGFVIITGLLKIILGYVPGSRVPSYSRTEIWTTVHAGMAIVCACLPIFKPLLNRVSDSRTAKRLKSFASYSLSFSRDIWDAVGTKTGYRRKRSNSDTSCQFAPVHGKSTLQQKRVPCDTEIVETWPLRDSAV